jgi:hypothetical protein
MTNNSRPTFVPSQLRRIFCSLFFVAAVAAAMGAVASSRTIGRGGSPNQSVAAQKIAPWVLEQTANGQQAEFFVVLADQADLSPAAALPTKAQKGRFVLDALLNKAQTTQAPVLQWLAERGVEYQSFYIVNGILVKGSREIAEALASRPDVARVEGNPIIQNALPEPVEESIQPEAPVTIEPGITYTHAPDVWALGFTGQQIVVGSADTGVQRNVVVSAQIALARRGLYHEEINGVYGPTMELSLRAYQARTRLPLTGRLDLETLAALRLLPGAPAPVFHPPRKHGRPWPREPIRGEWVPE